MAAASPAWADPRTFRTISLGDMPLIVLSAGRSEPDPSLSDAENQTIREVNVALQSELAKLSSNSRQTIAEQSGHFIQLDQPDLVIEAIREMVDTIRK